MLIGLLGSMIVSQHVASTTNLISIFKLAAQQEWNSDVINRLNPILQTRHNPTFAALSC